MKIPTAIICFLLPFLAMAQETTIPARLASTTIQVPERYAGTDAFEWNYTIANNTLRKQRDGMFVEYKNVSLGEIHTVVLTNPLQLVVFYRNFNTVVLLDNQLNETARINFSEIEEPIIADMTGLASQNRLWVFDANNQTLGLYDIGQRKFKPITPPFSDAVAHYQSDYNNFYWIDVKGHCYMSNLFGQVTLLGDAPRFEQAQLLSANTMLFKINNSLLLYELKSKKSTPVAIVENSFKSFYYTPQILSIFTEREIKQYIITIPE